MLTVFPDRLRSLYIWPMATQNVITDRDVSGNPGFTHLELRVTDQNNIPVDGAMVTFNTTGVKLVLSARTVRTDMGGAATIRLTAPDINETAECVLTMNATKTGFNNATQNFTITIHPYVKGAVPPPVPENNDLAISVAVITIASAIVGAAHLARKRRRGK